MYRADISFLVLKYIGMWHPRVASHRILAIMYDGFSFVIIFLSYIFTFSSFMHSLRGNLNMEEFTESLFFSLALLAGCVKIGNIFINRDAIIQLTDMLLDKRYSASDFVEFYIQEKFDRISRYMRRIYLHILTSDLISRNFNYAPF